MRAERTSRTRRGLALAATAGLTVGLSLLVSPALANVTTSFELDGNVLDGTFSAAPDWGAGALPDGGGNNNIFNVDANGMGVAASPVSSELSAGFQRDFVPGSTSDSTTYTNGSKDLDNISNWKCVSSNNVTDKGDIQNGYATAFTDASNHLILYFGMEKNAPNGDNNMGVWFVQDANTGCANPNGSAGLAFTGSHTDGDILLVAAFTHGGGTPTISAYRWNGGAGGSLGTTPMATGGKCGITGDLCAITNDTASVTTPWYTTNKASATNQNKTGQGTTLGPDQFYEGGIDLTANKLDVDSSGNAICVNKFIFDTRSSQSVTATLFDYAEGNVQTCASPKITTVLKNSAGGSLTNNTVTLPATIHDTSAITGALGIPTGTVTYSLWTNDTCTAASTDPAFSGPSNTATVTIADNGTVPDSPALTFTAAASYWWQAHYSGGGRNSAADSACTSEPLVVQKLQPKIATTPSPTSLTIGGTPAPTFTDTAKITEGYFPTGSSIAVGNVTFKLYGPFANAAAVVCTATTLALTSTTAAAWVTDTTAQATSGAYTPTLVGVYQWTAAYGGNAQNLATPTSACNDTSEQVTVSPATPSLATKILLSDQVKVSGVPNAGAPVGTVQFQLFPNSDCSGPTTLYDKSGLPISATGTASTDAATAVAAGIYSWKVTFTPDTSAIGNANYVGASTTCTPAQSDEQATISYHAPSPIS